MNPDQTGTELELRLARMEGTIDDIYKMTRRARFYSQLTFWVTAALIIIPLILLPLVIPLFLSSLTLPSDTGDATSASSMNSADITSLLSSLGM